MALEVLDPKPFVTFLQRLQDQSVLFLGMKEVLDRNTRLGGLSLKERNVSLLIQLREPSISRSRDQEMMKTEIGFVSTGEVPFLNEAREILASLLDFFQLSGGGSLAGETKRGCFKDFPNFANFVDFRIRHFADEETTPFTLIDQPFPKQSCKDLTHG